MRTLFRWLVVTLGVAAFVRWLRSRREPAEPALAPPSHEDPAEELRRKLAESRTTAEAETQPDVPEASVDERRAEIHAQGRSALAEMKAPDEG